MQYKKKFQSFIEIKITSTAFSMLIDLIQFSKELFYLKKTQFWLTIPDSQK